MSDADLPDAPGQGEPGKKGLLSRSVGAYKQAQERAAEKQAQQVRALYEYSVVPIRLTLVGDKMNVGEVQGTLDQWSAQGWRLRSIVETQVGGRVGPGGTGGLIIVLERRLSQV